MGDGGSFVLGAFGTHGWQRKFNAKFAEIIAR
jgi:hypothetical protein